MARALRLQIAGASYHAMSRGNARQPIVRDDNDRTERLELLKQNKTRQAYRRFIMAGTDEDGFDPFAEAVESLILGSDKFVERIRAMLIGRSHDGAVPQPARLPQRPTLGDIVNAVGAEFESDLSRWRHGRRIDNEARAVAAFLAAECFGHSATATAAVLGYAGPSSVTRAIQRIRLSQDAACNAKLECLIRRLASER